MFKISDHSLPADIARNIRAQYPTEKHNNNNNISKYKAILRASSGVKARQIIDKTETQEGGEISYREAQPRTIWKALLEEFQKQNSKLLGALHSIVTQVKLSDYKGVMEYGKAIIDTANRLNELGHPIEGWISNFYFLRDIADKCPDFKKAQIAKFDDIDVKKLTFTVTGTMVKDTTGYT